jgi:hypothetical protein
MSPSLSVADNHRATRVALVAATLGALVSFAVLYSTRETLPVGVVYDDAVYVDLANSLSRRLSYHTEHLPGAPPGVKYPPVYPAWLALWGGVTRGSHTALELQAWRLLGNIVLAALATGVWIWWGVTRLKLPLVVSGLMAVASTIVVPGRMVIDVLFSEPLGWLLLGGVAITWPSSSTEHHTDRRLVGSALLNGLLVVSRIIFLPIALATTVYAIRDRRCTIRARSLAAILQWLPFLLWMWWSHRSSQHIPAAWQGNYGGYLSLWLDSWEGPGDLLDIAAFNVGTTLHLALSLWSFGTGFGLFCLAIGLVELRRTQPWLVLGILGYSALVLLFPFPTRRYIAGILPLLSLLTAAGALSLVRSTAARPMLRAGVAAIALLPMFACVRASGASYRDQSWRQVWRETTHSYAPLIAWAEGLPSTTRVVTESDGLFGLATGLSTAPAVPWHPRDYMDRGPPLAERLAASLCETGQGWVGLTDRGSEIASALRGLMRGVDSVRLGVESPVGDRGLLVPFTCVRTIISGK